MQTKEVVIVSACRTAIGKFCGEFKNIPARDLAIAVGKEAISRAGIEATDVDEIVMGQVYTSMQGSLTARQVSMRIGMSIESNAVSVNQSCASGMRALEIACDDIQLGKTDIGLVVGVVSDIVWEVSRTRAALNSMMHYCMMLCMMSFLAAIWA